ncbi:MAG: hypothetical protein VX899_13680 [Myxococcota bacterium]|nr:hypothetical protein [Myxococcota bacterium]
MTVVLLLLACAGGSPDSRSADSGCPNAEVSGTVYVDLGTATLGSAAVFAQQREQTPLQAVADGEGHYTMTLAPGSWTLWSESTPGCQGDITTVALSCEGAEQDLSVERCDG